MSDSPSTARSDRRRPGYLELPLRLTPGLLLAGLVAVLAMALHALPGLGWVSPLILAVTAGVLINSVFPLPLRVRPGLAFCLQRLLRIGVALLGLQLTLTQVAAIGFDGIALIACSLGGTFLFTVFLGRILGVSAKLTCLIAAGVSVCGASAVVAVNSVIESDDADVAYAVGMVTLFGTVAMLLFPLAGTVMALDAHSYGLWSGAAIHEVAQVVAAAYQHGATAGDMGTIAKLTRVMMLVPLIFIVGFSHHRVHKGNTDDHTGAGQEKKKSLPWFAVCFLILTGVASLNIVPAPILEISDSVDHVLLTFALSAMGLSTGLGHILRRGLRPLALSALASTFIASISLLGVLIIP